MFKLFKKKEKAHVLGAVAKGQAVPLSQVNDPTFSQAILGEGAAVIPIGVAEWKNQIAKALPEELRSSLPSVEEIEKELEQ